MKKDLKNVVVGLSSQLFLLALGLVVPRIIIVNYNSDANGLLSTVTQVFAYAALLEAGIGQASRNALYGPIHAQDRSAIMDVLIASRNYYRRVTKVYALLVVILSLTLPIILRTSIDYLTVFLVVFFEGASNVIVFYYVSSDNCFMMANGDSYIIDIINFVCRFLAYLTKIILALLGLNIAIIQTCYFLISLFRLVLYKIYIRKHYSWIKYDETHDRKIVLKDRNSYVVTEIAWTVFSSTDLIILSAFVSTAMSSVYSVYNMVFVALNTLLSSIYSAINYNLGLVYHESIEKYKTIHDGFISIFVGGMTALMSIAYFMIIPFLKLYTDGINDINYIDIRLPILFCLVQLLSWSRNITGTLTGIAGYAKDVSRVSMIEAITNIILSLLLVSQYDIFGVLLATVIALPLKVIYCMMICDRKVLKRHCWSTIKLLLVNYLIFCFAIAMHTKIHISCSSYLEFVKKSIVLGVVIFSGTAICNYLINPRLLDVLKLRSKTL